MKKLGMAVVGLLLLLVQAASAQTEWKVYKVPGTRYSVEFPGDPNVKDTKTNDGDGLHFYNASEGYADFTLTLFNTNRSMTEAIISNMADKRRKCGDTSEVSHIKYTLDGTEYPAVIWTDDCREIEMSFKSVLIAVGNDVIELAWFYNMKNLKKEDVDPIVSQMEYFMSSLKMSKK